MVPGFHYVGLLAILALLIGSFINLCHSAPGNLYSASLICLVAFILAVLWIYIRTFPLKAQDRAIRADENLRYYVLTGKLFPNELTVQQIIALRFAPDSEFVGLVDRAIKENLSNKDIKLAIQNWKADFYRV
jgi:membrane-bound ClpP family serine protease